MSLNPIYQSRTSILVGFILVLFRYWHVALHDNDIWLHQKA